MAKRRSINSRAKNWERKVQQYLWEGSSFAGGAKRPALEDEDLRGEDFLGKVWWGEVKSVVKDRLKTEAAKMKILTGALQQCKDAIQRNNANAIPFAVLCPVHSRLETVTVLFEIGEQQVITTLLEFRKFLKGEKE